MPWRKSAQWDTSVLARYDAVSRVYGYYLPSVERGAANSSSFRQTCHEFHDTDIAIDIDTDNDIDDDIDTVHSTPHPGFAIHVYRPGAVASPVSR